MTSNDEDNVRSKLGEIIERLSSMRTAQVERDVRIASIHDTAKDTRERVVRLEERTAAQEIPKRLDSHAKDIGELKARLGKIEVFMVIIGVVAGALSSLAVSWLGKLFGK